MLEWLFGKKKEQPAPAQQANNKKKKLTQAEQDSEDKWQYQFLVQFLNSPLWRISLLDFIDLNCVSFDSEEENKFEYTKIHNKFKQLVGNLFDGMMKQIGLDEDKLIDLLERGFQSKQRKLFNQLLLCDDFLKFKELMVKRNKTLQQQAIKAINGGERRTSRIEQERSLFHTSLKESEARKNKLELEEQQILRKVLEMSKAQAEQKQEIQKLVEKVCMEEDIKKSHLVQKQQKQAQIQREREQKQTVEKARKAQLQEKARQELQNLKKQVSKPNNPKGLGDLPPIKGMAKKQKAQLIEAKIEPKIQAKIQPKIEPKIEKPQQKQQQVKTESNEDRKKRLIEQRQKIRKKKEEERKKMLDQEEGQNKKVMNIVLQDEGIHDSVHPQQEKQDDKISKDQIERRKELMKKIKSRIVDDF